MVSAPTFEGYWNNPDADEERTHGGIYWSGDLAYRDAEGFVYFAGRNFDWLRVDGENFAAAPVERILVRHPDIDLAAVYAVPSPSVGDDVMAAVVRRPGAVFDPDEFVEFLAGQDDLGTKWTPRYVRWADTLPQTETNKILKRTLRRERWESDDETWVHDGEGYRPAGCQRRRRDPGRVRSPRPIVGIGRLAESDLSDGPDGGGHMGPLAGVDGLVDLVHSGRGDFLGLAVHSLEGLGVGKRLTPAKHLGLLGTGLGNDGLHRGHAHRAQRMHVESEAQLSQNLEGQGGGRRRIIGHRHSSPTGVQRLAHRHCGVEHGAGGGGKVIQSVEMGEGIGSPPAQAHREGRGRIRWRPLFFGLVPAHLDNGRIEQGERRNNHVGVHVPSTPPRAPT